MMRDPVVFYNQGQKIIGVLHEPDFIKQNRCCGGRRVPAVAIFHGFTGTKVEPHRIFVKMAESLVSKGIAALRFDFRGSGDSEGDFAEMTLEGEISDAIKALDFLSERPELDPNRIGVLGLSMGGTVAAAVTGRDSRVKACVLWAAAADFSTLGLTQELQGGPIPDRVDMRGNVVGRAFLEGVVKARPADELARSSAPVLILHGDSDETVPYQQAYSFLEAARISRSDEDARLVIIKGGDHTFNSEPLEREVITHSTEWFVRHLLE